MLSHRQRVGGGMNHFSLLPHIFKRLWGKIISVVTDNFVTVFDDDGDSSCHFLGDYDWHCTSHFLPPPHYYHYKWQNCCSERLNKLAQSHVAGKCQDQYSHPDSRARALPGAAS